MTSNDSSEQFLNHPQAARLTPPGRGAVAVVKLLGDPALIDKEPALFMAANTKPVSEQPLNRIVYGHWNDEDLVVCRTEDLKTEICCHGGHAAVNRILNDLSTRGVEIVDGFELVASENTTFQTECQKALSQTMTIQAVNYLLGQSSGIVETQIDQLRNFAEQNKWSEIESEINRWKTWIAFGRHLTSPWNVALIGRPNVGKSSLLNRLLGYDRAIVFDQPGTTRDLVSATTAFSGWPIEFTDTAGLRESDNEIEAAGIAKAIEHLAKADLTVLLLDATVGVSEEDRELLATHSNTFVVWNKSDQLSEFPEEFKSISGTFISALNNEGIEELLGSIVQRLVPETPQDDSVIPFTERQRILAERILVACRSRNSEEVIGLLDRYLND